MIWCRFSTSEGPCFGVVEGASVLEIRGSPFGEYTVTKTKRYLDQVKILVPVTPGAMYATGSNYRGHIEKQALRRNKAPVIPAVPAVTNFSPSALIAHEEDIVRPSDCDDPFEYEAELVVVVGKRAKHVSQSDAFKYVFGYTVGNDVSARAWQQADRLLWRGKSADTFKPLGPFIVTDPKLEDMKTTVRMNGEVTESFQTNNMIFGIPQYIAEITKYITLHPGDLIWMGTDGLPRNMKPGDTIDIDISGVGLLRNRVVAG
jgi:2-keto-4-pentenoate hydratase/2-oxohepta-3-ene-1,7-dioic acid hydratase in catechol pathway